MKTLFKIVALLLAITISAFIGYSFSHNEPTLDNLLPEKEETAVTYPYLRRLTYYPTSEYVKVLGRTVYNDKSLWFSMSGSGAEFFTDGEYADVTFLCQNAGSLNYNHQPRIAVFVNSERIYDETLSENETLVHLELSDFEGQKTVSILKLSESMHSSCGISKITVYGKESIRPTEEKELKIEFIGDSITTAYGVDAINESSDFSTHTQDFTKSYAFLASQKLDADYSCVAFSGYGVYSGYSSSYRHNSENVIFKHYEKAITNTVFDSVFPLEKWNFEKFQPDIVVINLGVNDAGYCSGETRKQEFVKAYKKLLGLVRWYNKEAYILCVLGDVNNSLYPYIEQAVTEYKAETDDYLAGASLINYNMGLYGSVAHGHPTESSHISASEDLYNLITKITDADENEIKSLFEKSDETEDLNESLTEETTEEETTVYVIAD